MKSNNLILILVIVLIVLSLFNVFVVLKGISEAKEKFTGYALGYLNVSIQSSLSINLSRASINWSSGIINASSKNATLYTRGDSTAVVERGNWSVQGTKGFILENIGNINSSLSLQTTKNAHDFFNSLSNSNEQFMWNVSNKEPDSCSGGASLGQWQDVNKTSGGTKYCGQFSFNRNKNEIYIDLLLTVPSDSGYVGELSDTITITGDVAG